MDPKSAFLAGLSAGRALKGWGGSGAGEGLAPLCRNDPGVYTYFYIDYRYALQNVSFGRFRNKTTILGSAGEIVPREVERVDSRTVKVWADMAGETVVHIFGNAKPGLSYFDGRTVGAFSTELYLDGTAPYALPYMAESAVAAAVGFGTEEGLALAAAQSAGRGVRETVEWEPTEVEAGEALAITYG